MATIINKERRKSALSGVAKAAASAVAQQLQQQKDGDYYLKNLKLLGALQRTNDTAGVGQVSTSGAEGIMQKIEVTTSREDDLAAYTKGYDYDKMKSDSYYQEVAKAQGVDLGQPYAVDTTEFAVPDSVKKAEALEAMNQAEYDVAEQQRVDRLVREGKQREALRKEKWRGRGAGSVQTHQPRTWLERTFGEEYPIKTAGTAQESAPGPYEGMTTEEADALAMKRRNIVSGGILRREDEKYDKAYQRVLEKAAQQDATEYTLSDKVKRQNQLDAMHQADYGVASTQAARDAAIIEENVREEAEEPPEHWETPSETMLRKAGSRARLAKVTKEAGKKIQGMSEYDKAPEHVQQLARGGLDGLGTKQLEKLTRRDLEQAERIKAEFVRKRLREAGL